MPLLTFPRHSIHDGSSDIINALRKHGAVVVSEFISVDDVAAINQELDPHVDARSAGFRSEDDTFYGSNTVRIQALASKSPTFISSILLNELMKDVGDDMLLPNCGNYWMSQAETIFIGPGNPAQVLHRDDLNWSVAQTLGIDLQVSVLVALGDYDTEVGATMVIPDSHLMPITQPINAEDAVPVELQPGDALLYLGSTVHGGGANRTANRVRRALYMGFLVGWLTPEEAVSFGVTEELAASLSPRARQLLGWGRIRGNKDASGPAAALQLWQLDNDDPRQSSGIFYS